jgi:DNA-binding transcriptional MerR regulator
MNFLPGTTVEVNNNTSAKSFLDSAFATGGLVLSQVVQLTGLEPHTIQNWVKRQFIPPPDHKKYSLGQFCRIVIINMLKDIFQIDRIAHMLDHVCEADSTLDEAAVYVMFCEILDIMPPDTIIEQTDVDGMISGLVDSSGANSLAKDRLKAALKVMTLSFISARIRNRAEMILLQTE